MKKSSISINDDNSELENEKSEKESSTQKNKSISRETFHQTEPASINLISDCRPKDFAKRISSKEENQGEHDAKQPIYSKSSNKMELSSARSTSPADFQIQIDPAAMTQAARSAHPLDFHNQITFNTIKHTYSIAKVTSRNSHKKLLGWIIAGLLTIIIAVIVIFWILY